MRIAAFVLCWSVLLSVKAAAQQQGAYIDPALRPFLVESGMLAAARRVAPSGAPAVAAEPLVAGDVVIRRITPESAPSVALLVQLRNGNGLSQLQSVGARIGSQDGDIVTADVPVERLPELATSDAFVQLQAARWITTQHDTSMKAIRADVLRRVRAGLWTGTAGQGVIVGVYDTGLDFLHEDFLDAERRTRVLGLWDQTATAGPPPVGFNYGRYCTSADIQQVIDNPASATSCPQRDNNGHGTHTAGTAAGDGSDVGISGSSPFTYAGVAPRADLMIVKGGEGSFAESDIVDGLRWLEQQAAALNRPMVVNLSLGGQFGPHDGTLLFERVIDNLSRPGFMVVVSAGNEGANENDRNPDGSEPARNPLLIHSSGLPGGTRDHSFEILPYSGSPGVCNDRAAIAVWYEAADRLEFTIIAPNGSFVTAPFASVREQDGMAGLLRIDNASSGVNPANGAQQAIVTVTDCGLTGATPLVGLWTLRVNTIVAGSGRPYHMWLFTQSLGGTAAARGRSGFDNRFIIGSPGNARAAITVGAFATKLCWDSPAKTTGPVCFTTMESTGDLARFSSAGPTRDGRAKPEIAAPGMAVISAKSRFASIAANRIVADGVHWVNQGTSMAAPHVTGAIALMLQHNAALAPNDVRSVFASTAMQDEFTSRTYGAASIEGDASDWWGSGKLNVCAAVGRSSGADGALLITPVADTLPVNATGQFSTCGSEAVVFQSSDPAIVTVDAEGVIHAVQIGSAFVIASAGSVADTALVVVTAPATLAMRTASAAPATPTRAPAGTVLPLLSAVLRVSGFEPVQVTSLAFRVSGQDPGARMLLVRDGNRNGRVDTGETTLASAPAPLMGASIDVTLSPAALVIAQRDSIHVIAALELSGQAPNATAFTAELLPALTHTAGLRSLAADRIDPVTTPVQSAPAVVTVLAEGSVFSLSENPVRSGRVVFNFTTTPSTAAVYALTGRRVVDLTARIDQGGSVTWDLTNENGDRIASGVYLVVFNVDGQIMREKLFVTRSAGSE